MFSEAKEQRSPLGDWILFFGSFYIDCFRWILFCYLNGATTVTRIGHRCYLNGATTVTYFGHTGFCHPRKLVVKCQAVHRVFACVVGVVELKRLESFKCSVNRLPL